MYVARTLLTDTIRFMALLAQSRTALAAENLFLRKQLAFYQERKIRPRRFDNVTRFILVLLSHGFAWKGALVNVTPVPPKPANVKDYLQCETRGAWITVAH